MLPSGGTGLFLEEQIKGGIVHIAGLVSDDLGDVMILPGYVE